MTKQYKILVNRQSIIFSEDAYQRLCKPPSVRLAFVGDALLIASGDGWPIRNKLCRPSQLQTFIRPGLYMLEPTPQPGVLSAKGCTYHFYKDYRAWA